MGQAVDPARAPTAARAGGRAHHARCACRRFAGEPARIGAEIVGGRSSARSTGSTTPSRSNRRPHPPCSPNELAITPRSVTIDLAQRDQERSLQIAPTTCHDLTLLATSRLSAGDHLGAEQALKEALRHDVTSFWAWFVLGHCHYAQGRFLESAGDFAACAARGPEFAWVHFNRGLALARAGRPLEARYAYDRALALDPSFSEALVNRGMVELELNQLGAARAPTCVRSIELGRDDVVAMTSLGETLARMGRRDEAERFFADLLARNPRFTRRARGPRIHPDRDRSRPVHRAICG